MEAELDLLSKVFVANGYPQKKVQELMKKEDSKKRGIHPLMIVK